MINAETWVCIIAGIILAIVLVFVMRRNARDKKHLANLALFPQQNPNPVIEVSLQGEVTYMNPAAEKQFPEMKMRGLKHELFSVIQTKVGEFVSGKLKTFDCEV